jgi:hypothetical protein
VSAEVDAWRTLDTGRSVKAFIKTGPQRKQHVQRQRARGQLTRRRTSTRSPVVRTFAADAVYQTLPDLNLRINHMSEQEFVNDEPDTPDAHRAYLAAQKGIQRPPAAIDTQAQLNRPSHRPPPDWSRVDAIQSPTVALDPGNIIGIEGYEAHSGYVQPAVAAMKLAHESVQKVIDTRKVVNKNDAWHVDRRILKVGELADKLSDKVLKSLDSARSRLLTGINSLEVSLSTPLAASAASAAGDTEIRSYVAGMTPEKRVTFMQERVEQKDLRTLAAVVSMPSYLSGLSDDMVQTFAREYQKITQPEITERLRVMKIALERLERGGAQVMRQFESALGYRWNRFNQIKAREKATKDSLLTD